MMANRAQDWLAQARHDVPAALLSASKRLDKHYLPTRYPNGFDVGTPKDYCMVEEARLAIDDAEQIYDFCKLSLH